MKRTLRFLWEIYGENVLKFEGGFAAVILAANLLFAGNERIFGFSSTYVLVYPMLPVLFAAIFSYSLTTLYREQALSFPCRRQDFFWGSQVMFLLTALIAVVVTALLGWALETFVDLSTLMAEFDMVAEQGIFWAKPAALWELAVLVLLVQPVGAAVGCLYRKHKVIAIIIYVFLMLLAVGDVVLPLMTARSAAFRLPAWVMPTIYGVLGVSAAVSEVYYALENRRATVR